MASDGHGTKVNKGRKAPRCPKCADSGKRLASTRTGPKRKGWETRLVPCTQPGCAAGRAAAAPCDVHEGGRTTARCERCRRYAFLSGYAPRTDEEQREVIATRAWLRSIGKDPGWGVVPRERWNDTCKQASS